MKSFKKLFGKFSADEFGVSTIWSIFWTIVFLLTAGIAIDTSNAYRFRSALQATADSTSLSAAMAYRDRPYYEAYTGNYDAATPEDRGREVGKQIAKSIMGTTMNGTVVSDSLIEYGNWDVSASPQFNTATLPVNAVKVIAKRTRDTNNQLETIFLGLFGGLQSFDVGAASVTEFYQPECVSREGVMAGNFLNIASNNTYRGDLCLYGDKYVDMNNGIFFYDDTVVQTMIDGEICMGDFPGCNEAYVIQQNSTLDGRIKKISTGMPNIPDMYQNYKEALENPDAALLDLTLKQYLPQALVASYDAFDQPSALQTDLLGQVRRNTTFDGSLLLDGKDFESFMQDYVDANEGLIDPLTGLEITPQPLAEHTIYEAYDCPGNKKITFPGPMVLRNVVIMTDCEIVLSSGVEVYSSMIMTSAGDPSWDVSMSPLTQNNDYGGSPVVEGSSGVTIGTGTCAAPEGGSVIVSAGDIKFPAGMEVNFSQILTKGDMSIAAQGDGTKGTSLWAWGTVTMTSNGAFEGCSVFYGRSAGVIPEFFRIVN